MRTYICRLVSTVIRWFGTRGDTSKSPSPLPPGMLGEVVHQVLVFLLSFM